MLVGVAVPVHGCVGGFAGTPLQCWETYVGQQLYTFLIINMLVEIVTSLGIDPIRKRLYEKTTWFRQ